MAKLKAKTRSWEELEAMLQKMGERLGGIGNNLGDVAEDFFYDGLNTKKRLGKIHFDDVKKFAQVTIPLFKKELPQYAHLKTYGAVAGLSVPRDSRELVEKLGLFVLTQSGDSLKVVNSMEFALKAM